MNDPLLSLNITSQKNFITEGDVGSVNGTYTVLYNFLTSKNQLNTAIGYDVITAGESASNKAAQNIEYAKFSATTAAQQSVFNAMLGNNTNAYSVFFTDITSGLKFQIGAALMHSFLIFNSKFPKKIRR